MSVHQFPTRRRARPTVREQIDDAIGYALLFGSVSAYVLFLWWIFRRFISHFPL